MNQSALLGGLVGAVLVGLAWVVTSLLAPGVPRYVPPPSGGNVRLLYTIETGPNTSESGDIRDVRAVEFHPGYVVVQQKSGSGRVFFPQHTRNLSWANYGGN